MMIIIKQIQKREEEGGERTQSIINLKKTHQKAIRCMYTISLVYSRFYSATRGVEAEEDKSIQQRPTL